MSEDKGKSYDGFYAREFNKLSEKEKTTVISWIKKYLKPRKNTNNRHSSYGIKHFFENDKDSGGYYITNEEFKGAMLVAGFEPRDFDELNWNFRVDERSFIYLKNIRGCYDV